MDLFSGKYVGKKVIWPFLKFCFFVTEEKKINFFSSSGCYYFLTNSVLCIYGFKYLISLLLCYIFMISFTLLKR